MVTQSLPRLYISLAGISFLLALLWSTISTAPLPARAFPGFFYQHIIGTLDGHSCPSYPVCSVYSRQAIEQYGLLYGAWLSIDRLIHESDDLQHGPWIMVDQTTRLNDPLQRNAFWLKQR